MTRKEECMIDLCKVLGVEVGEEFKIDVFPFRNNKYKVYKNELQFKTEYDDIWRLSDMGINTIVNCNVIKLPKKKEFTDDELCILRNIDSEYNWVARSSCENTLLIFAKKPVKNDLKSWSAVGKNTLFNAYNHLFQSIQWEDEEPVYIDDYVSR